MLTDSRASNRHPHIYSIQTFIVNLWQSHFSTFAFQIRGLLQNEANNFGGITNASSEWRQHQEYTRQHTCILHPPACLEPTSSMARLSSQKLSNLWLCKPQVRHSTVLCSCPVKRSPKKLCSWLWASSHASCASLEGSPCVSSCLYPKCLPFTWLVSRCKKQLHVRPQLHKAAPSTGNCQSCTLCLTEAHAAVCCTHLQVESHTSPYIATNSQIDAQVQSTHAMSARSFLHCASSGQIPLMIQAKCSPLR